MKLLRILVPAALLAGTATPLLAATGTFEPAPLPTGDLRLAQSGDVDIIFDDRGNRIIVDTRTGEVIAVEPPRRVLPPADRRALRRQERERRALEEDVARGEVEVYEERRGNERVIVIEPAEPGRVVREAPSRRELAERERTERRAAERRREAEREQVARREEQRRQAAARQAEEEERREARRRQEERREARKAQEEERREARKAQEEELREARKAEDEELREAARQAGQQERREAARRAEAEERREAARRAEAQERREAARRAEEDEIEEEIAREEPPAVERRALDEVLTARPTPRPARPAEAETAAVAPEAEAAPPAVRRPQAAPGRVRTVPLEQGTLDGEAVGSVPGEPALDDNPPEPDAEVAAVPEPAEPALEAPVPSGSAREEVAGLQILLDRAGASPGVIDGRFGSNVDKALQAYNAITGQNLKTTDGPAIEAALDATGGPAFIDYTITPEDAAGPFVASVPADYGEKAKLERLGFTAVSEMLAERFHMDEDYLKALNPEANFNRPGTVIRVANVGQSAKAKVARIVADKSLKQVRGYDAAGKLVVGYPATIGSPETPSPTGSHAVKRVAFNPEYTYNPNVNFKQGENTEILTIPPGPNGPVGSIWIALSKPTYGIHGTPEPSRIGKSESHGCVRLTNWDAAELAALVEEGVTVEFLE